MYHLFLVVKNGGVVYIQGNFPAEEPRSEALYEQTEYPIRAATFRRWERRGQDRIYSDSAVDVTQSIGLG